MRFKLTWADSQRMRAASSATSTPSTRPIQRVPESHQVSPQASRRATANRTAVASPVRVACSRCRTSAWSGGSVNSSADLAASAPSASALRSRGQRS